MSKRVQLRRGTATQHNTFTGADGEVTVDTTNKTLRVHDGDIVGGTILAKASQLPASASATTQGLIEIATQTEVNAGTDSTRAIVPNTLLGGMKTHLNVTGSAPIYACRAWVNFNGTGTVAIRGSGNVSSITDNGTGNYKVNFITAMPNVNYSTVGNVSHTSTGAESRSLVLSDTDLPTVEGVSFTTRYGGDNTVGKFDPQYVCLSIFG